MNYGKVLGIAATIVLFIFLDSSSLIREEFHRLNKMQVQQSTNRPSEKQHDPNNDLIKRGSSKFTTIINNNNNNTASNQETSTRIQESWDEKLRKKTNQLQQHLEDSFLKLSNMFTKLTSRFNNNTIPIKNEKEQPDITQCSQSYQDWKAKAHPIHKQKKFSKEISTIESLFCRSPNDQHQLEICNVTELVGVLGVHEEDVSHQWLHENELSFVHQGGWWTPEDCLPIQSTLIVIPFRDREDQLPILLRHLHPMLKRQQLHYRIIIVEQTGTGKFNRAKLANIGFVEGLKMFPYQCFIIHDVDLVPENDHIDYSCSISPRHLSAGVSTFNYKLPYAKIFGGVSSLLSKHFQQVNGFSNLFYGWGGEDDNMYGRLAENNFKIQRHSIQIARYKMLKHKHYKPPVTEQRQLNRKLVISMRHNKVDGLNTLQYDLVGVEESLLYTRVKVDVREDKENFIFD